MTPAGVCGPLDVGDVIATIETVPIPADETFTALRAAISSPAFDGSPYLTDHDSHVANGPRSIAKAQTREHERLGSALWFEKLRTSIRLPAPALLDYGTVDTPSGPRWWLIMQRVRGTENPPLSPNLQRQLGAWLRIWHEQAPPHGLRLDDPGGLGVLLGTPRAALPDTYPAIAQALAEVCEHQPMTAIHGDTAVGHNALFDGENLAAILDPGAVHVGPPMVDLAWCLAIDLPHGAAIDPLLDGYGREAIDSDTLQALLPHLLLRRLVDTVISGDTRDARWLAEELRQRAPDLLKLSGAKPHLP